MLAGNLVDVLPHAADAAGSVLRHSPIIPPFAILAALLLVWRLMRFTLLPAFRPDEPKEYPYWIPVVGHLKAFVANSQGLLTRARLYYGNTREPFAITMGGQTFYVVTKPADVSHVFRESTALTFEIFAQEILQDLGCTEAGIKAMYEPETKNKNSRPPARHIRDFHVHQLFPGKENLLDDISTKFMQHFERAFTLDYLRKASYSKPVGKDGIQLSLFDMASDIFTSAAQDAYFGSQARRLWPTLVDDLLEFDDLAWQVLFKYPPFLSKKMVAARDRVFAGLEKYFASPLEDRKDVVWFTPTLEKEMRQAGLGNADIAKMVMTIYWGVSTNTRKGVFWLLAYLLYDAELLAIVRKEIAPAFQKECIDVDFLQNKCPRLRAAWDETMRLTAFSSSVRYITRDTPVGNKVLRKGYRIMMPYRQMHLDESVFLGNVTEFDSERFLKNPQLRRYNMAFGGGATQCPGRHLATSVIMIFAAMTVHRFEIEVMDKDRKGFPKADESTPVLGIIGVKKEHDLELVLTPRQT